MQALKIAFAVVFSFALEGCSTTPREVAAPSRCAAEASAVSHIENLRAADDGLPSLKAIEGSRRKALAQCLDQEVTP